MRHTSFFIATATLTLLLGGCNFFGGGNDTATEPSPSPTVEVTVEPEEEEGTATQPFGQPPVVQGQPSPAGTLPPDLISSTDPNQRIQGIQRNRPDPFALLPTTPRVQAPPVVAQAPTNNTSPSTPQLPSLPQTQPQAPQQPGTLAPIPNLVPQTPPRPQATLAELVKVSGVVQIGSTLHAIVSAPNEPSSRYVRVGQRLSNGQVLVKRIEMAPGGEPVVVLEQNGIEVVTAVGEGGSDESVTPTASVINSPNAIARR